MNEQHDNIWLKLHVNVTGVAPRNLGYCFGRISEYDCYISCPVVTRVLNGGMTG